ncbi:BON domain-containing protein [Rhodococcus sp. NPDC003318]|uniref:BON domain-containing protein n=1 Tax=Rhodococcus sp. NPDC003318 TaxID=3364503 RepID=UPI0036A68E45
MSDDASELPQYVVAHLRRAFAEDPRTCELGIRVSVRGRWVYLSGEVTCEDRKDALEVVLWEHFPSALVRNDVHVMRLGAPVEHEDL